MQFNNFLGAYYRDTSYGGDRLYADMLAQAQLVDRLGFRGVTIPEHHLINILLIPDPLQFAVKVASMTEHLEIVTSVCQLPLHDMRVFAGQVIQADILCEGRLVLGVGRGAFAYELARMGKPIEESRERFDESLNVLMALLAREEVSWEGKYYQFAPITVMPRPRATGSPAIMIAALVPAAIEASARRGFHIQTTPLNASVDKMREQLDAFKRGKAACGESGRDLRLAVMRMCCVAKDDRRDDRPRVRSALSRPRAVSRFVQHGSVSICGRRCEGPWRCCGDAHQGHPTGARNTQRSLVHARVRGTLS
jgi:alkanesulfonate monooxygenase SsuD/methylene tetrahydromethanopterin reductase-like flavin-dependent oxidoreductase (luciferase family)